jgi:hypothetical protein
MSKPVYEPYCARECTDDRGQRRKATEWIHVNGRTEYVCAVCARAVVVEKEEIPNA